MKPRITISRNEEGTLEIWLNEAGRDLLVRKLSELHASHEHLHMASEDNEGDIEISSKAYRSSDEVFPDAKILFRRDEWDQEYFPHVMDSSNNRSRNSEDSNT